MSHSYFRSFCIALGIFGLSACGHTPVSLTFFEASGFGKNASAITLNPKLRYLRITAGDRVVLMVLGYLEPTAQGLIETWYSSDGEVLRLQNGRVFSTTGMKIDWRSIRYAHLPTWNEMSDRSTTDFDRVRDEIPGYRFGISETISLDRVSVPGNAKLMGLPAKDLIWYEETVRGTAHSLPSARYGLRAENGQPVVVYGEQCFSNDFCFAWQTWPVTP